MVKELILFYLSAVVCITANAQTSLDYYLRQAEKNSPQIKELLNQKEKSTLESERLKAVYKSANVSMNGNLLIVPIISQDNGKTTLEWNAQNAGQYYGYDLGQANSSLNLGLTWSKPLLDNASYNKEKERLDIEKNIQDNSILLNVHDIKKAVTDQYILCITDKNQIKLAEGIIENLNTQYEILCRLAAKGLAKNTDLQLLDIERNNNGYLKQCALQSYHTHKADLDIMCGINDTIDGELKEIHLEPIVEENYISHYNYKYTLDSMHTASVLKSSMIKYRPKLNVFIDGGVNTADFSNTYRRFGISAGMSFSWLLFDGKQKRNLQRQADADIKIICDYRDRFIADRIKNKSKYIRQLEDIDIQKTKLQKQMEDYDRLLENLTLQMQHGEQSVIDYVTVLRNKIQAAKDDMTVSANRELLINALNYWNW